MNPKRPISRHYTLVLLTLMFIVAKVDRNIVNIFLEQMKAEFGATDFQMSLVLGLSFSVVFTLGSIPIARLADAHSRRVIILVGIVAWSLMTMVQGAARSLLQLGAARVMVGAGEATISPAAQSIIGDLYPPTQRAVPLGIFGLGGHIGMLIGFALGGLAAERLGWKLALVIVGFPGLLLAVLGWFTLDDPPRGHSEGRAAGRPMPASFRETARYLGSLRAYRNLLIASALYAGAAISFNMWGVAFMQRIHGLGEAEAGLKFGLATGVAGILGTLVSGGLVDRLATRDVRWLAWIPALGGIAMIPFLSGFLWAPDPDVALVFYSIQVFFSTFWMAPSFSMAQGLARVQMRATSAAILLFVINGFGTTSVPAVVGALSDRFSSTAGPAGLRTALFVVIGFCIWAAIHSLRMAGTLEQDFSRVEGPGGRDQPEREDDRR